MPGRLIDIPYDSSPPLIFTFRQTATAAAGTYNFTGTGTGLTKTAFTPSRPIQPNVLYILRTLTFAMDIAENDYHGAISTQPEFSAYVQSSGATPSFREPVVLAKYFDNIPYTLALLGEALTGTAYPGATGAGTAQPTDFNRLLGTVTGVLNQTMALAGKLTVTAIIMLSAQEVVDSQYIQCFTQKNPPSPGAVFPVGRVF